MEEGKEGHVITGKYRIVRRIGVGGMGAVYEVERVTRGIHFRYALKQLRRELEENPDVTRRFIDEARRMVELLHPNIVRIIDIDDDPDFGTFILMELINGPNLSQVIREQGRRPYSEVVRLGTEIGSALDFAHSKGVIHRDIKPQNILIEEGTGRAVLTDFGIAKKIRVEGDETDGTKTGFFIGTQRYASPQQMRNETPEPRWDIYSLGAVLYEAFSGRRYLEDMNENQIFGNVGFNPGWKPSLEFPVAPPPRFMRLLEECLEKERDRRVANASDLVRRLRECLNDVVPEPDVGAVVGPAPPLPEEPETKKERYEARRAELRAQAEERLRLLDGLEAASQAMGVAGEWTSTQAMRASLAEIAQLEQREQFGEAMQRLEALCEHGTEVRRSIEAALNDAFTKAAGAIDARWGELKQRAGSFFPAAREQDLQRAADAARESMRSGLWGEASRRLADGRAVIDEAARTAQTAARQRVDALMAEVQSRHTTLHADFPDAAAKAPVDLVALQRSVAAAFDEGHLVEALKQSEDADSRLTAALEAARRGAAEQFAAARAELEGTVRRLDVEAARAAAPQELARAREAESSAEEAAKGQNYRGALDALAAASAAYREAEARLVAQRGEEGRRQQLAKQLRDIEEQIGAVEGLHEIARGIAAPEGGARELGKVRESLSGIDRKAAADQLDREIENAQGLGKQIATARAAAEASLREFVAANVDSLRKQAAGLAARAGRFLPKDADLSRELAVVERSVAQGDWKGGASALADAQRRLLAAEDAAERAARQSIDGLLRDGAAIFESLTQAGRTPGGPAPKDVQAQTEQQFGEGNLRAAAESAESFVQRLRETAEAVERQEAERSAAARATVDHFLQKADIEAFRAVAAADVARAEKSRSEGEKAERARHYREATAAYEESFAAFEEAARRLVADQDKRIATLRAEIESALAVAASSPPAAVEEGRAAAGSALKLIGKEDRARTIAQLESAHRLLQSQLKEAPVCAEAIAKRDEAAALQAKLARAGFSESEQREAVKLTSDAAAAFKRGRWSEARDGFAAAGAAWAKLEREAEERIRAAEERARRLGEAKKQLAATVAKAREAPEALVGEARSKAENALGAADASLDDVERAGSALEAALAEAPLFRSADEQRTRAKALEARVVEEGFKPRVLKGPRRQMAEADAAFAKRSWKDAGEHYAVTFQALKKVESEPPPAPSASRQIMLAAGVALVLAVGGGTLYYVSRTPTPTPEPEPKATVPKPQPTAPKVQPTVPAPQATVAPPEPAKLVPFLASAKPDPAEAVVVKENEAAVFAVDVQGLATGASPPTEWLLDGKPVSEAKGKREFSYKPDFAAAREKPYAVEVRIDGGQEGKNATAWNVRVQDVNRKPQIVRESPSTKAPVSAKPGDKLKFSIEAKDEDGDPPQYAWKLDGKPAGKNAPTFDVQAAEGQKRVTVEVGDGKGESPITVGWDVALLRVPTPEIKTLDLRPVPKQLTTLPFEGSQTFALEARGSPPGGIDYEWTVDGQKVASGSSFRFRGDKQSFVRKAPVRIAALARAANAKPFSYEWNVKIQPPAPKIARTSPSAGELDGGSAQIFEVNAGAPIGEQRFTYVFEVDGRESQRSERSTFRFDPPDDREHVVASRVVDNFGNASERKTWRLRAVEAVSVTALVENWLAQYKAAFNGKDVDTLANLLQLDSSKKGVLDKSLSNKRDLRVALKDVQIQKLAGGGATASYKQVESFVDPTGQPRSFETSMKQTFRLVGSRVELEK